MHCATAAIAFCLTFGIILDVTVVSGLRVTWFEHTYHRGNYHEFDVNAHTCYNLGHWSDRISSINTHGGCVVFWSDLYCRGHRLEVGNGRGNLPNHSDFKEGNFNDIASSVELCGNRKKREVGEVEENIAVRWDEDDEVEEGKLAKALEILKRGGPPQRNAAPVKE